MMTTGTQRGFTLIETIIAISVLMLGVLGPMTLARQNIKAARAAEDHLVASFLAQEGIEMVRNNIANNAADNVAWLDGITSNPGQCDQPFHCIADLTLSNTALSQSGKNILQKCNGLCTPAVYLDSVSNVYRQAATPPGGTWAATKYNRLISVTVTEAGKRVTASTTVWWSTGSISLQEDIYDWYFQLN